MNAVFTMQEVQSRAAQRPDGYLAMLMQAAVSQDADSVTFDMDHPAWRELEHQYRVSRPLFNLPTDPRTVQQIKAAEAVRRGCCDQVVVEQP
jgi:hypothetical protein